MAADGKANRIKVHILNHKLFAKFLRKQISDFHIDAEVLVAFGVFERREFRVGRNNKLVFGFIQSSRGYRGRRAFLKILVENFFHFAVFFNFSDEGIHLFEQFRLIFVYAECIFFFGQVDVDDLNCGCFRSVGVAAASGKSRDHQNQCHNHC